jgi:phosphatidylglycerophosphate synthase
MTARLNQHDVGLKVKVADVVDGLINHYFCATVAPWFKATGHTANLISIYGTVLTLGALWYLWKDDMLRFSVYFWLAYLFDCLDGYFARKYDMVTTFGDVFEHVRDTVSLLLMMMICVYNYIITKPIILMTIVSSILTGIHVGCVQQRFIDRSYEETLDLLKGLCINETISEISMCYGVGMYMTTLYLMVLYMSGGAWLFLKLTSLSIISLYFLGLYYKRCAATKKVLPGHDIVQIPQTLIPGTI